jgi:hypothetical protein
MTYVSKEELEKIQGMNAEFSKAKIAKYGQDSVINLQTGEVTQKQ